MENDEIARPARPVEQEEDRNGNAKKKKDERETERGTSYTFTPSSCFPFPRCFSITDSDLVCFSEDGPDKAKSRFRRNRRTSSPSADTFVPHEWELENLRKQAHVLDETMTKLEPWIVGMLQRNRVELPPELDHFLDRCEANRYLNFTVEEVVDQNWSAEEEKKDGMARSKINRTRIVSSVDIDPYVHEPVRSSCSTHHRGVSGLPLRPSPPSAIVQFQPSGVNYQMKEILPRKAARTTSNVIANETRSESAGSKSAQTCPCANRQYEEPQRSSSVHQPQYRKGSPILYEPEFVATIKRNKRKVEFDSIKIGMEERQKRKELMDAVLAHIHKVVPKEQPQDIISTQ